MKKKKSEFEYFGVHCRGFSSLILMQRCWHEMKVATRRAFTSYTRGGPGGRRPPSPLYAAIAKRLHPSQR